VTLTVSNANGTNSKTSIISIRNIKMTSQKPIASFSKNVTAGYLPLSVAFTDNTTGFPTEWNGIKNAI
jgi:PKD repeat protein